MLFEEKATCTAPTLLFSKQKTNTRSRSAELLDNENNGQSNRCEHFL